MDVFESVLGDLAGGRVLNVATKEGGFVQILMESLKDYTEIVGIDINDRAIERARDILGQEDVRFLVMNAEQLDFEDKSFDTVSISASLHHLSDIQRVLEEMKRILKPGGHFIAAEMHQDGQTEAELTSVYLHQWVAEVDSALGRLHNSTLARQELTDYIASLGLSNVEFHDYIDRDSDPMEKARIEQLKGLIERVIQRAEGASNYSEFKERGEELRKRLLEVGTQREPILIVIGEK
ncbi:MAG TPA: methyltransferase domain-containing protein [Anaerolineae bacterium]|nr:methyltransferase domain-containing protein [Anaerolineae bacterium]